MKNRSRKIILTAFSCLFLCFSPDLFAQHEEEWDIQITADEISYAREEERILARGNVKITYMDMLMTAGKMSYSRHSGLIEAEGNINFERDFFSVESSSMVYNIHTTTGRVYFARVISKEILNEEDPSTPPLVIEAESIDLHGEDEFFIPRGRITTCDAETPHYYFSGSSLHVKLEDSFSLKNALFVVRGVPLFYYPYYRRELGTRKLIWHLDAGSSKIKGTFIKAGASYPLTKNSRTGLGFEIMQKGGPGIYLDHSYLTENGNADFKTYYLAVEEGSKGRLEVGGRQKISKRLTARYRGQYSSERMIEHDYYGQENYGEDTLFWLAGGEYTGEGYTVSVYGDRTETWKEDSYEIDRMTLPGIGGRVYSLNIGRKFIFAGSADYRRRYNSFYDRFISEIDWDSSLRKNYRLNLTRRSYFSIAPGAGYDGVYRDGEVKNYISFFSENRFEYMGIFRTDTDYSYRKRYKDSWNPEDNRLDYRITLRPYRALSLTTRSSYDFTENEKPVDNFVSEAEYTPGFTGFYLRNRYDYYERKSIQWLGELTLGQFSKTTVRYDRTKPGVLDIDQQIRFKAGPLDLMPALRFNTENYYDFDSFTEKRLDVLWDMHCWESRFRLRRRADETELWILFNIKVFPEEKLGLYGNLSPDIMDFRYHKD